MTALTVNLTATEADAPGYLTVYPCAGTMPATSNLNFGTAQTVPNFVMIDLTGHPENGKLCIYASERVHVLADVTGYVLNDQDPQPTGGRYNSLATPRRLLDSREATPLAAGESRRVAVVGTGGVPATGVSGAALNVTAVNGDGVGYLTVYPCGTSLPNASNVNYAGASPVPNAAIVGVGADGGVCVYASSRVDVIVDISGWFGPTGADLIGLPGIRLLDSRTVGIKLRAGVPATFPLSISGNSQLLNVVITEPAGDGYATVYPCDTAPPLASNLNFTAGQTVANGAFVRIVNASYCILSTQDAHVVVDWAGATTAAARTAA